VGLSGRAYQLAADQRRYLVFSCSRDHDIDDPHWHELENKATGETMALIKCPHGNTKYRFRSG
jgi:hypothetical protein